MSEPEQEISKEARILRIMRHVLTSVIKDTSTPPGMKHPLSDETIEDLRQCLGLIAARERELAHEEGRAEQQRPRFTDEPETTVGVPLSKIGKPKPPKKEH